MELSARGKPKASTVIRALDAIERASRWKKLTVFFDEFQDIVENLEERDSRHLLGVLRAEIQRHTQVSYIFTGERSHFYQSATFLEVGPIPEVDMSQFFVEQFARGGRKDEATPAQRRILFALALREGDEVATDSFIRFSGFKANGSVNAAMRPFLKGTNALLEKTGSRVRFRDRFVRLWLLVLLNRNPGMFPASRSLKESAEQRQFLTYIRADNE
ncbi:MAG TPA: hypothetical protein VGG49_02850 [Steroidobacteraceae bacterium]